MYKYKRSNNVQDTKNRANSLNSLSDIVMPFLESKGGIERSRINALWDNWRVIMGEEIASLGMPLGHKDDTLIIGAEDSMALQELTYASLEIVERANAFMDYQAFLHVRISLLQEKKSLDMPKKRRNATPLPKEVPPAPAGFGALAGKLDPESPVTRCYNAFLELYFSGSTKK